MEVNMFGNEDSIKFIMKTNNKKAKQHNTKQQICNAAVFFNLFCKGRLLESIFATPLHNDAYGLRYTEFYYSKS
jgi:hypothetical protein